jgi:magnesium chelatase family protein
MSTCQVHGAVVHGITAHRVVVDAHVGPGLPSFTLVGVPDAVCREMRDRIRAAFLNQGWAWPMSRVTVTVTGGAGRRRGGLDLPVAVAVAEAAGIATGADRGAVFYGSVGLDGSVRPAGGESAVFFEHRWTGEPVVVAADAVAWAVDGERGHAAGVRSLGAFGDPVTPDMVRRSEPIDEPTAGGDAGPDLTALEVLLAACGVHGWHDGGSQADLGRAVWQIRRAPVADPADRHTIDHVRSVAGYPPSGPFYAVRAPHASATVAAMAGGDRPGELSLGYGGAVVIDAGNMAMSVLDAIREPVRTGSVVIARSGDVVRYPTRTTILAAYDRPVSDRGRAAVVQWAADIGAVEIGGALARLTDPDHPNAAATCWAAYRVAIGDHGPSMYGRVAQAAAAGELSETCGRALIGYAETGRWSRGALQRAIRLAAGLETIIAAPHAAAEVAASIVGY